MFEYEDLVMGSGGREHALVWKLRQSPRVTKSTARPAMAESQTKRNASGRCEEPRLDGRTRQSHPARSHRGRPELPLMLGVVDEFTRRGWRTFGPLGPPRNWKRARALPRNSCSATAFQRLIMRSAILLNRCATPCRTSTLDRRESRRTCCRQSVVIAKNKDEASTAANEMLSAGCWAKPDRA